MNDDEQAAWQRVTGANSHAIRLLQAGCQPGDPALSAAADQALAALRDYAEQRGLDVPGVTDAG
jgi:hypothetical protein